MFGVCDCLERGVELRGGEADVGVPAKAAGEDTGRLDGRRLADSIHGGQNPQRKAPAPALAAGVVLRIAGDLHDGEDVPPAGCVADGKIALLDARPARRGMGAQRRQIDLVRQEPSGGPANEEPVLEHRGFLTGREYPRLIGRLLLLACALLAVAGCGGSSSTQSEPPAAGTTTVTAPTTTAEQTDPLAGAGTNIVVATSTAKATSLLERVAIGHHDGYDRVVFEFRDEGLPGYRVEYVQPPLKEDGSGAPVDVAGNAFVVVRMEPASGFDLNTGEGELVYKGPKRIAGSSAGATVVQEVVRTGDFEAVLSWAVGLEAKVPFRVTTAASPSRLIVDFKNV
jgi:hypothetical protein